MSSMRIVLVDPLGDILFSGESWLSSGPATANAANAASYGGNEAEADETEAPQDCPETMRSGESGIFPVERAKPTHGANDAAYDEQRDERAA